MNKVLLLTNLWSKVDMRCRKCRPIWFQPGYVIYICFWSQAAIFDFQFNQKSNSIRTSPVVLLDTDNMGVDVEAPCLSCTQAKICMFSPIQFRLKTAIFD